jgi:hypothetical protein
MTHRLYILWSNKLIIGVLSRDCGGITITAGPIRSRNRTPTKHLGSAGPWKTSKGREPIVAILQ